jgi:outer membrane translocation and assembly module TamA
MDCNGSARSLLSIPLQQHGLRVADVDILGDGNCFYNAISQFMFGNQAQQGHIRAFAVQFLRENEQFTTDIGAFEIGNDDDNMQISHDQLQAHSSRHPSRHVVYLQIQQNFQWATPLEIVVVAYALNVHIKVKKIQVVLMVQVMSRIFQLTLH